MFCVSMKVNDGVVCKDRRTDNSGRTAAVLSVSEPGCFVGLCCVVRPTSVHCDDLLLTLTAANVSAVSRTGSGLAVQACKHRVHWPSWLCLLLSDLCNS